jgi:oxalate decarboxylase/phosphoglucose isomerase-like protein (cupin superfamily)
MSTLTSLQNLSLLKLSRTQGKENSVSLRWQRQASGFLLDIIFANSIITSFCNNRQTIYVPSGWWHMVINMDDTVAVTHNFADEANLLHVKGSLLSDSDEKTQVKKNSSQLTSTIATIHSRADRICH